MSTAKAPAAPSDRICEKWFKLPPCLARRRYGRGLTVQPDCLKGWVVCGAVYGDMH